MNYLPIIALVVAAMVAMAAGVEGHSMGKAQVQQLWDAEKSKQEEQRFRAAQAVQTQERSVQDAVDAAVKDKNEKLQASRVAYQRLAGELSKRPARPGSTLPSGAGDGLGCTGASLPRPDAEFLVGESARADKLRVQLDACKTAYEKVRGTLNERNQDR